MKVFILFIPLERVINLGLEHFHELSKFRVHVPLFQAVCCFAHFMLSNLILF